MKIFFTKTRLLLTVLFVIVAAMSAVAQTYPETNVTLNVGATGIAKDASGNIYVIQTTTDPRNGGTLTANIVKYAAGSTTGVTLKNSSNSPVSFTYTDGESTDDYPLGIVVDSNGNIFVSTYTDYFPSNGGDPTADGAILKFTNSSGVYSGPSAVVTGSYNASTGAGTNNYGPMVIDASNNIFVTAYDYTLNSNNGGIELIEFPGENFAAPSVKYKGIGDSEFVTHVGDTYSTMSAMAMDASGNIWVATPMDVDHAASDGGKIIEITAASGYTSLATFSGNSYLVNNAYCSALGFDSQGNLYATNGTSSLTTFSLIEYPGVTGTPITRYTNGVLGTAADTYYPFGIAAVNNGVIWVTSGSSPNSQSSFNGSTFNNDGSLVQFIATPATQASSVSAGSITEKTATISWTNGSGASRAVFVALNSAGSISLTNGTAYSANTAYGSGTQAGTGWYCVYNGSGSTNSVSISGLTASTSYKMMVVEYNGGTGVQNYDTNTATNNPNTFSTVANPSLTASGGSDNYSQGGSAVTVDAGITATAGQTNLSTATISVSGNFSSGDVLSFTNQNGITGSYVSGTGVLTLSGSATVANYQTALQSITFSSSSASTSTRTISFLVGDGTANSSTVTKTITVTASTTISSLTAGSTLTNGATVNYTATFAASVSGVSASDFTVVTGGSVTGASVGTITGSGTTWTVPVNTGSGDGTVQLEMNSSSGVTPSVSNATAGSPFAGTTVTIDKTSPTIGIGSPSVSLTNSGPVSFTVTYSDSHFNTSTLSNSNITLNNTGGNATASTISVTGSGTTRTVTLSGITGNGPLGISIAAGTATDLAGNTAPAAGPSTTFTVDNTAPTAVSLSQQDGGTTTNQSQLDYQLVLSEDVTGVDASDFTIVASGVTSNPVSVTQLNGHTYNVSVSNVNGNGTFQINLNSSGTGIADAAGNAISGGINGDTFTVDQTAPTVSSITATTPSNVNPTNASTLVYTVTFSEPVTGLDITDFSAVSTGVSASLSNVSGSGTTWTVTLTNVSGNGTIGLNINTSGDFIKDAAGNNLTAGFTGDVYNIDQTAPTVSSITATTPSNTNPTNASTLVYTVTFSEPVTGLDITDFSAVSTGVSASLSNVSGSGTTWTVTLTNVSGNGTIGLNINPSGDFISDAAGNYLTADFTGDVYNIDNTAPVANTLVYKSNNTNNQLQAVPGDVVTLSFTTNEAIQTPTVTIGGNAVTANNTSGNDWTASYTITNSDPLGRLAFSLSMTDIAGNTNSYNDVASGDDLEVVSTDATLSNLVVNTGTLNPSFDPATTGYTVSVPNSVSSIDVTPTLSSANATLTVNTNAAVSGNAVNVTLAEGVSTPITVQTLAQDGSTSKTYTINVTRAASADATLLSMNPQYGPMSPSFRPLHFSYNLDVSNAVKTFWVAPVSADANASIVVNGTAVSSGAQSTPITLNEGTTTLINVVVTAQDGSTSNTYQIHVSRAASANADLSLMGPNTGRLTPFFQESVTSYSKTVGYSVATFTVSPVSVDPNATIKVNGVTVASGSTSQGIALTAGQTTNVNVVVTAQDGSTTKTYTIAVTRPLSSNATLSALGSGVTPLIPMFAPGTNNYAISVPFNRSSTTVTPTAADPTATITVNGTAVTSGTKSGQIALAEGAETDINVVVTAQDGTTNTYTVAVTRGPSTNASLSAMGPSSGPLSPVFAPGTTSYTLSVPNNKPSVTVTPVTADANATITVNGTALASGTTSAPVALTPGMPATVTVVVTAQDGSTTQTYTITTTRALSSDATLSAMGPQYGPLSPVFQPGTNNYAITVANSKSSFTVTPVTHDANATITVNGTPVTSGSTSDPVSLTAGLATPINVAVTAQDGTTNTYTVQVTRALSSDATLSAMGPQYGPLSPAFAPGTTSYTLNVPNSKATMTVTPVTNNANATLTVNGMAVASGTSCDPVALTAGAVTNINVVVTAQDGTTTQTYTIAVTRALANDALLSAIGPQYGPLTPVFSPGTTDYTIGVANTKTTFTVTPVAHDPMATITVNGTAVASGSTSDPVALTAGANTNIVVVVTAQDGTTTDTYTIAVNRAPGSMNSYQDISVTKPAETVTIAEDGIKVHQGISPNGDGIDDVLQIDNISQYPDNHLKIMNRNGELVFEAKGYDNVSKVFDGHSNKNGKLQLPGTYFFQLEYTVSGATKVKTGYLVLKY